MEVAGLAAPEVPDPDESALFLDLDGTVAAIASHPADVVTDPARTALLAAVRQRLNGRLAVISGRSLADIDRILPGLRLAAAGLHGLERRTVDGRVLRVDAAEGLAQARAEAQALARAWPGAMIEDKGAALALHFRAAPQAAWAVETAAERVAAEAGLRLQRGDRVVEWLTPGPDKGQALRTFMGEQPFIRARPVFVGDDLTDEAGFEAARALGGLGVLVGPPRTTRALRRLETVAAVFAWLTALVGGAPDG